MFERKADSEWLRWSKKESSVKVGMRSPVYLQGTKHSSPLKVNEAERQYQCASGCVFPVIGEIPRFVAMQNYADPFGLQWNRFRSDQLDSYTGLSISRGWLTRLMGGTLDHLKGKIVLEAGCGAGRFTEGQEA